MTPGPTKARAIAPPRRQLSRRKKMVFSLVLLLIGYGIAEVISLIAIAAMPEREIRRTSDIYAEQSASVRQFLDPKVPHLIEMHPRLGWRYAANYKNREHQLNSIAVRSTREYTPQPGPNVLRLSAFGDSYVYSSEVDNPNAWAALMESEDPNLEVLNYGVGGYGVDQAYLRYLDEGPAMAPHVVLIGFTLDDVRRTVNVYRRFLAHRDFVLFKPRFLLDTNGELSLVDAPMKGPADYERLLTDPQEIRRFRDQDYWYSPAVYDNPIYDYSATVRLLTAIGAGVHRKYLDPERIFKDQFFNTDSTAYKIQAKLFEQFSKSVREKGAIPFVVMLPDDQSIVRARKGEPTAYEPFLAFMREKGIAYLDAAEAFQAVAEPVDVPSWFAPNGHYSPAGNQIVARWLAGMIRKKVAEHDPARLPRS